MNLLSYLKGNLLQKIAIFSRRKLSIFLKKDYNFLQISDATLV